MSHRFQALAVIAASALLFFAMPGPSSSSPLHQLTGFVHLSYFALLAWWLTRLPELAGKKPLPQIFMIMLVLLITGGTIELLQPLFGRNASWSDLGMDLLGGLMGLFFLASGPRRLPRRLLAGGRVGLLTTAVVIFSGPAITLWDMGQAALTFPVLGDFENSLESRRWTRGEIDSQLARQGKASLRVPLVTKKYTGTTLHRSFGNWQGYETLAFSLYNPLPDPLEIIVSISDQEHFQRGAKYHDRFNRSFKISQGWNDLLIPVRDIESAPAERILDLARLRQLVIFTVNPPEPRVIYLDDVRLIR
jgi:hypothetical protein